MEISRYSRMSKTASRVILSSFSGIFLLAFTMLQPHVAMAVDIFGAETISSIWTQPEVPIINAKECEDNKKISVGWQLEGTPTEDQTLSITTSVSDDCAAGNQVKEISSETATIEGTVDVFADDLLPECPPKDGVTRYICVRISPVTGASGGFARGVPVFIDTVAPNPPDTIEANAADNALRVEWSWTADRPEDLQSVTVFYRMADDSGEAQKSTAPGSASYRRIDGLLNDETYEIWVVAIDDAGNESEESERVLGTPQPTRGFWELYREQGGEETGGCSHTEPGGTWLVLLSLIFLLFCTKFRKASIICVALFAISLYPLDLSASQNKETGLIFEFDLGPYKPDIDSEFGGSGPYREIFGTDTKLMLRLRTEKTLWQNIGQASVGLSAGISRAKGEALFADGTPSSDESIFGWLPLQLFGTYRFDYTLKEWNIPLVPYFRLGLQSTVWWVSDPSGIASDEDGNRATGMRTGWFYSGGLMLNLNVFDKRLAMDFRRSSGVINTYLYMDFTQMFVDGFGSPGFNLSDNTWFAGLSFEF